MDPSLDNMREFDANELAHVQALHQHFPELTHQEIIQAIQTQGPGRDAVLGYLQERQRDKDPGQ